VEVDPVSLEVTDVVTTELQLGGEIYDFTLPLAGRAHAVVSTSSPSWEQFCVAFDWASGNKLENVWKPGGYSVMDVELHEGSGQLFLADRTYASPGVRVFDAVEGDQLTTGPLTASLPPHDLLVVGDQVASVEPQEAHRALSLSVWPNPMREGCSLSFFASAATTARVVIYDASGRVVRTVLDSAVPAGDVALPWDGLDRWGRPAAAGVYFVRVEAGEAEASTKVVLLR